MVSYRPPLAARHAYILVGIILAGVLGASLVSRNESRQDFIIRQEVGDFEVEAPELEAPDFNPDFDGPNVAGPNLDAPNLTWLEVVWYLFVGVVVIGLIIGLLMLIQRFGPEKSRDVDQRTTRLATRSGPGAGHEGEEGWAAFERFCYELLQDPDPSRAVRVVMRYAEAGLGRLPTRQAEETPNEWSRRIRADQPDLGSSVGQIVTSYNSVRFADQGASPAERDRAVDALRRLARAACGETPPDAPVATGTGPSA